MTLLLDVVLLTPPASATVAQTLPRVGQTATDTVRSRGQITGAQTLPGVGQTATSTSGATGGGDFDSDFATDFAGGGAGAFSHGFSSGFSGGIDSTAALRNAAAAQALGRLGQTATAVDAQRTATVDQALGRLGQTAGSQKERDAVAAQTLGALGQRAKGKLGLRPPPPITDQDRPLVFPIVWPKKVLPPQSIAFNLKNRTTSGGLTIRGDEQIVASATDRWHASLSLRIHRPEQVLAYRWIMAQAGGRLGTWLIPSLSHYYISSWTPINGSYPVIPFLNGEATFSDSSTFSDLSQFGTNMVQANVTVNANVGVRSLTVQMIAQAPPPLPGTFFSIGQSIYTVVSSLLVPGVTDPAGPHVIQFRPGLRASAPVGAVLEFTKPSCLMRLANDDVGELDLDMLRFGSVKLDFVEVVPTH